MLFNLQGTFFFSIFFIIFSLKFKGSQGYYYYFLFSRVAQMKIKLQHIFKNHNSLWGAL